MSDDQNLVSDDMMDEDLEESTNTPAGDVSEDMLTDDSLETDASVKAARSPLLDLEEDSALDADFSEPKGLEHSDPGVNDEATLDATMWHKGVDDNLEEEDIEALGFHVEGGSDDTTSLDEDI